VYALDQKGNYAQYNVDQIYYADTASVSDGKGIAGDWSTSDNNMWTFILETSAAHGDITW
jgi:hypothetical protein